ncbi:hypothetical protein PENTCL1PPCAC_24035 [Pristionchus entomophagus]|uniref:Tyrosine phosphatase n=1 Tax=Pristionchus entomophagus TaxID=358040 RepID=A0AAV5U4Q2_9BILA|nr:hypothetical protein PENTCL1PPCAC_24035 [Pristionchus entomophagus]
MVQFGRTLDIILICLGSVFLLLTGLALCIGIAIARKRKKAKRRAVSPAFDAHLSPHHLVYEERKASEGPQQPPSARSLTRRLHRPDRIHIPTISQEAMEPPVTVDTSIPVSNFGNRVQLLKKDDGLMLYEEFESLNRQTFTLMEKKTTTISESNMRRNRFFDVLTFDHNRVELRGRSSDDPNSYINASYIQSNDNSRAEFIAAQGPIGPPENIPQGRENTVSHFWEMIWQERVDCLVMLTRCIEHLKLKCAQYWPNELGSSMEYGSIRVELVAVTEYASAIQRTFDVSQGEETRNVTQFHFEDWLDAKGPENTQNLLDLVLKIKDHQSGKRTPILVHCSAGIGRTGVFIALWQLITTIDSNPLEPIDVMGRVKRLREQRIKMVQSSEQYSSLYEAVVLYLKAKGLCRNRDIQSLSSMDTDSRYDIQEVSAV